MIRKSKVHLHETVKPTRERPKRRVWQLRWVGANGKRYGEVIGEVGVMTKREALDACRKKQSDIDADVIPMDKPERMTLGAFESLHEELARGECSPGTMLNTMHSFRWAKRAIGADTQLTAIDSLHVAKLRNLMADEKKAAGTIAKTLSYMRSAFNRARKHKLVTSNPFAEFKVANAGKAKDSTIRTRDEIKALKAGAPDGWWRALIGLWFSGLRLEESLSLQWDAIDLATGMVTIRQCDASNFKIGDEDYPVLAWQAKTARSYRTVPVPADTILALRQLKEQSDGSPYAFLSLARLRTIKGQQDAGKWRANSALVNNLLRDWQALQRRVLGSGVDLCTIHDCRKTFCTHAADLIPINALADIVGDTVAVLTKFYTKTQRAHEDKLRAAFDDGPALRLAV